MVIWDGGIVIVYDGTGHKVYFLEVIYEAKQLRKRKKIAMHLQPEA